MSGAWASVAIAVMSLFSGGCSGKQKESGRGGNDSVGTSIIEVSDCIKVESVVGLSDTLNLRMYFPAYSRIDFVTDVMPSKDDASVIMVAAGAFTAGEAEEEAQGKIAGDHVSTGVRKKGYVCPRNNGAFVYYDGQPKFIHKNYDRELDLAAENGGCGFTQEMMIHNGMIVAHTCPDGNVNEFRALCMVNGKLAVVDSRGSVKFGDFIRKLRQAGVTEALYLDMGDGWNYSWYRDDYGRAVNIHPELLIGSNWITFYRD